MTSTAMALLMPVSGWLRRLLVLVVILFLITLRWVLVIEF